MKVLFLASYDVSLVNFRGDLLRRVSEMGHEVVAAAPLETEGIIQRIEALRGRFAHVRLARVGMNPFCDLLSLANLWRLFRKERPDVVMSYTVKPVIYGSLAAKMAGVPQVYALITGLGSTFFGSGYRGAVIRSLVTHLYRIALTCCKGVLVQNNDIAALFICEGLTQSHKIVVIPGSGVDVSQYSISPMPSGFPVYLLLARMLRDKGIEEYVAAARIVKSRYPQARFLLIGHQDLNPSAIQSADLERWTLEGVVEYRPGVPDVRSLLAECTCYVLPSYHEGMPRSVLEAMATGRPVITTDTIGCRETIINAGPVDKEGIREGENGLLVPVKSVEPLAKAMLRLANNRELAAQMGARGRKIAVERFDVHKVNRQMMEAMGLIEAIVLKSPK